MPLVNRAHEVHVLEQVVVVVRGHAVGAERHVHARIEKLLNRREPACELHVGGRVQNDGRAALGEDLDVLVVDPHAVRRNHRHVEHADALEVLHRREAVVAALAFLVLAFRLGDVDMDGKARRLRHFPDIGASDGVGRVFGMDVVVHADAPVLRTVVLLDDALHLLAHGVFRKRLRLEVEHALANVHLHMGLAHRLHALVGGVVHVRRADRAVARHLGESEFGRPVVVLGGHLALEGPHEVVEPLLQGHVLRIAAQKRHRQMRVGVVERRHEQAAAAVVGLAVVGGVLGGGAADVVDRAVFDAHPLMGLVVEILVEDIDVGEKQGDAPLCSLSMVSIIGLHLIIREPRCLSREVTRQHFIKYFNADK